MDLCWLRKSPNKKCSSSVQVFPKTRNASKDLLLSKSVSSVVNTEHPINKKNLNKSQVPECQQRPPPLQISLGHFVKTENERRWDNRTLFRSVLVLAASFNIYVAPQNMFLLPSWCSRFPCRVLLVLSWNTNENPSTDKLSRAIN